MHKKSFPYAKLFSPVIALALASGAGCSSSSNDTDLGPINSRDSGPGGPGQDGGGNPGQDGGGNPGQDGGGGNRDGGGNPGQDGGGGNRDGGGPGQDGGGGNPDSGPTGNFNAAQVAAQLASAQCGFYMRCEPARFSYNGWQMADCVSNITTQLSQSFNTITPAVNANRVAFHQEKLTACISEYSQVDCQLGSLDDSPCNSILQGLQATGAGCMFGAECQAGNWCNNQATGDGTCGKCAAVATAMGQACNTTGFQCANFLTCINTSSTAAAYKCVADNSGENGACAITYAGLNTAGFCRGHLECVGATGDTGTCKRPAATAGATCDPMQAANPSCDVFQNFGCGAGNTCTAVQWQNAGSTCGTEPAQCNHTAYCPTPTMMGQTLTCTAQPGAGASCADQASTCTMGNYCDNLLMTSTNTCMADKTNGAQCLPGQCTAPSQCIGAHVMAMQIVQGTCGAFQYQQCQ